jgi:enoyl-CoA hydratase
VAAGGALRRLPQRVPYGVAMELALTGDTITAERGYELGLVERWPRRAGRSTRRWSSRAPSRATARSRSTRRRRSSSSSSTGSEEEFWQRQGELSGPVFAPRTRARGAVAFSEKRDPVWQGR